MVWHQQEGNNIDAPGVDSSGAPNSPGYNSKCGFQGGTRCFDIPFFEVGDEHDFG